MIIGRLSGISRKAAKNAKKIESQFRLTLSWIMTRGRLSYRLVMPGAGAAMIKKAVGTLWKILPQRMRGVFVRSMQTKFTVSAAAVIYNEKNEVLLLNHVLRPGSGWGLPGGFIDSGEQPEDAIRREIREETGIELNELRLFRVRTLGTHVEMLFSAIAEGTPEVKSREIIELGWFAPDATPAEMSPAQRSVIDKISRGVV